MSQSITSLEKINHIIQNNNPFDRALVVRQQDIWGQGFPDLTSFNSDVSRAIFRTLGDIHNRNRKVAGITIRAERGCGKSHLISRIRHSLQKEGGALFIYMGEYSNLEYVKSDFRRVLVQSLSKTGSQNKVMQWQEIATEMFNKIKGKKYKTIELIQKISAASKSKLFRLIDKLTTQFINTHPNLQNPDLVRAIFWTFSKEYWSYAIKWLAGQTLSEAKANEMGLPNPDDDVKETVAFDTACQIINLISDYFPLLICFDELDSRESNTQGLTRAMVVTSLVKDLFNKAQRCVFVTSVYPSTWKTITTSAQSEAIIDRIGEQVYDLKPLNSETVVAVVGKWLENFYQKHHIKPPHSVYPFDDNELKEFGREKPVIRELLSWCAKNFIPQEDRSQDRITLTDSVEAAFNDELQGLKDSIQDDIENDAILAKALYLSFKTLIGETLEGVTIEDIVSIHANGNDRNHAPAFKIVGRENNKIVKIGVSVLQQPSGNKIQAVLKRLINYRKFDLTRGCLVRGKKINRTATQAQHYLRQLLRNKNGEWVLLQNDDIKPLLAILKVKNASETYNLNPKQIKDFIQQQRVALDNPLIREIISAPSGEIPENAIDEDIPISTPQIIQKLDSKHVESNLMIENHNDERLYNNFQTNNSQNHDFEWIKNITNVGNSSDGNEFEKLVRKAFITLGFGNSNQNSKASLDPDSTGGAGGIDFYCETPYPLVGECKATKTTKVPSGTPAQLIKLGQAILQREKYARCIKIIMAAGQLTSDASRVSREHQMNVLRPETLQKLTEIKANYPGSIDLWKLKKCLEAQPFGEAADGKVNEYIEQILQKIKVRSHLIKVLKETQEKKKIESVTPRYLEGAYDHSDPPQPLKLEEMKEILIELSSPLTGYLGRKPGENGEGDRFYFLRELEISHH